MRAILPKLSFLVACRTGILGILCIIIDYLTIGCTFGFTLAIAGYFGHEPFKWHFGLLESSVDRPTIYLVCALALSLAAILARLIQAMTVAKITVSQEMWYANKMRRARPIGLNTNALVRASNHYGRLASSSIRMYSAALIVSTSVLFGAFSLNPNARILVLFTIFASAIMCAFAFTLLGRAMAQSSRKLVFHARHLAQWKSGAVRGTVDVRSYANAYFLRLFLPGLFGLAPLIFAAAASIFLMILRAYNVTIDLASTFVGVVIAQAYLGLLGRVFNEALKIAAFAPAVVAVWDTVTNQLKKLPPLTNSKSVIMEDLDDLE